MSWNEKELLKEIDHYFDTHTKEEVLKDLEETGCLPYMEEVKEEELPVQKHDWEPTDNQGHSMECVRCGIYIGISEPEIWNEHLNAECTGKLPEGEE